MATAVRMDSKGRLVIPQEVRDALAIGPGDTVWIEQEGETARLARADHPFVQLAAHALKEHRDGKTRDLREFMKEQNIPVDGE